jgi:hypothetical protein
MAQWQLLLRWMMVVYQIHDCLLFADVMIECLPLLYVTVKFLVVGITIFVLNKKNVFQ